ncbi:ATP-binding cassette domain-containing protein [Paucibacter sp. B2R-40]|uniref:ATP-binding cassette domain-containing protein n=1 Tax=Paucibacter sp. B2R-40 TaxID=2893554 RepID=UPI0021E3FA59|nr:ATP-binding cassette domain-containing protein [Paucibacter sp. B2R-40]MCV2355710.1 ATP-binding cassette domain-containing protein [Paucibacter sp. B2R-40]
MRQSLLLFLRANRRHLAELLLAGLMVNLLALALPMFSMLVYDKAMGNQVHDTLWALATGMLMLLALELLLRTVRVLVLEHAGARWDSFLDERLMRGVLSAPLSRAIGTADVMNKLREISATRDVLSAQGLLPLADLPFMLVFVLVLAAVGGHLVWIPLGFGVLMLLAGVALQHLSQDRQRLAHGANRLKINTLVDVLASRESLHGRPNARSAERRWREQSLAGARAAARARWWAQMNQQLLPVLMSAASVALLVAGVFRVEAQEMSVGGLISVNMIASRFLAVLCSAAPLRTRWVEFSRALGSLGETVELSAAPLSEDQTPMGAFASEGLRLEELNLTYPAQTRAALEGLNLQLRAGELVAVVGASGSGKSSLLKVLAGHLPHAGGRLVVAGNLVADDASRHMLCQHAQYKSQDPCFLGGTVREIVAAGEPEVQDASVVEALRMAGFGPALERGDIALNTPVGTNGLGLSGGQRQMLALAVAFHGRQPILLLDEPTLGLDRNAQEKILQTLPGLKAGRCVLVATHAAELIQRADRVIVLDRGRLVADAPPDRLLPSTATWPGRAPAARANPSSPESSAA